MVSVFSIIKEYISIMFLFSKINLNITTERAYTYLPIPSININIYVFFVELTDIFMVVEKER